MISLVAAMSKNRVIGNQGKLPWGKTMPSDIKRYLEIIDGKTIVMGAKTYAGADHARDKSQIVILSRRDLELPDGVRQVKSVDEILALEKEIGDIVVTGGGQVFKLMIEHADRLYLTVVDEVFEGDAFFPEVDENKWVIEQSDKHPKDELNAYGYEFVDYIRK